MGYKFNNGHGAWVCDKCSTTMFDYLPPSYVQKFLSMTTNDKTFKGVKVWAKGEYRFCTAKCMKRFYNEDDSMAAAIYDVLLRND